MYNENYKMTFYNNRFIVFSMDIFLRFGGTCSVCLFRDFKKKRGIELLHKCEKNSFVENIAFLKWRGTLI